MARTANVTAMTHLKARDDTSPKLKRMAATARRAAKSIRAIRSGLGSVARTAGIAAVAVGGIGLAIKKVTDATASRADDFAKFSRQIGISAETLQNLEFVAGRQGASFENMSSGMVAMTKRMGELKAGTGSLRSFLLKSDKAFLQQLESIESNEAALEAMLGYMSDLPDEQRKMAFAAAAFSRGAGADMVKVTAGGSEEMRKLIRDAQRLRPALGGAALKAAEAYSDAMFDAKQAGLSVRDTLGVALMPTLTDLAKRMAEWVASNRALIETKSAEFAERLGNALSDVDWTAIATSASNFANAFASVDWAGVGNGLLVVSQNLDKIGVALASLFALSAASKLAGIAKSFGLLSTAAGGAGMTTAISALLKRLGPIAAFLTPTAAAAATTTGNEAMPTQADINQMALDTIRAQARTAATPRGSVPAQPSQPRRPAFVDMADDAKAHRGTGRTSYGDDGAMRALQTYVGSSTQELKQSYDAFQSEIAGMREMIRGAVDMNVLVRVEGGGSVQSVGTVKRTALVGNVGTNIPSGVRSGNQI